MAWRYKIKSLVQHESQGRAEKWGPKYDEMYEVQQPRLSWQVYSGLTGIAKLEMNTFTAICEMAISFSADCYQDILLSMIDEFKIDIANTKIKDQLKAAKLAPFGQDSSGSRPNLPATRQGVGFSSSRFFSSSIPR